MRTDPETALRYAPVLYFDEAVVRTASLEEKDGETMGTGREFPVSFRPFEIQTLRVIPVRPERKNRPGKRKRRKWLKR